MLNKSFTGYTRKSVAPISGRGGECPVVSTIEISPTAELREIDFAKLAAMTAIPEEERYAQAARMGLPTLGRFIHPAINCAKALVEAYRPYVKNFLERTAHQGKQKFLIDGSGQKLTRDELCRKETGIGLRRLQQLLKTTDPDAPKPTHTKSKKNRTPAYAKVRAEAAASPKVKVTPASVGNPLTVKLTKAQMREVLIVLEGVTPQGLTIKGNNLIFESTAAYRRNGIMLIENLSEREFMLPVTSGLKNIDTRLLDWHYPGDEAKAAKKLQAGVNGAISAMRMAIHEIASGDYFNDDDPDRDLNEWREEYDEAQRDKRYAELEARRVARHAAATVTKNEPAPKPFPKTGDRFEHEGQVFELLHDIIDTRVTTAAGSFDRNAKGELWRKCFFKEVMPAPAPAPHNNAPGPRPEHLAFIEQVKKDHPTPAQNTLMGLGIHPAKRNGKACKACGNPLTDGKCKFVNHKQGASAL